jgi:DNA-binding NarL/FixJ family response regulator
LVVAEWSVPDERTRHAWANEIDTTEAGAYCVALAAIEMTDDLVAIRRAETHTGADYYVAPKGASPTDLEEAFRLEVSGMKEGSQSSVNTRLRQKLEQTARGRSSLPAIAAVVAFSPPQVAIAEAVEK